MQTAARYWAKNGQDIPNDYEDKLVSMATYCTKHKVSSIPDPYFGGEKGFEDVLDLLDDACSSFLRKINEA